MATGTKKQVQRAERREDKPGQTALAPAQTSRNTRASRRGSEPSGRRGADGREQNGGQQSGLKKINEEKLAHGLGWFSIGLGLAELLAPRGVARIAGLRGNNTGLIRLFGLREIASGIAIFAQGRRPAAAVWSRVAGDALDLAALGAAFASPDSRKGRLTFATANVLAVSALDVICARRLSENNGSTEGGSNKVKKSIIINGTPEELYRFWRELENLPRIMNQLESVRETGDRRSHWVAKAPAGETVEWDAEITEDRANERISWRSIEGSDVDNSGSVEFETAPGGRGTIVRVEIEYNPPGGALGAAVAKLFGKDPGQQADEALRCFKQVMELGEIVVSDGTVWDNGLLTQRPAQPVSKEELSRSQGAA